MTMQEVSSSAEWIVSDHQLTSEQIAEWGRVLCGVPGEARAGTQYPGCPGYDPIATRELCRFDPERAARALRFFPAVLRHQEGDFAHKAFGLEPWQRSVIANLFGWVQPDGRRRYRECLIYIPRKNGKSTLAAGIALYMLIADGEYGAQVYCIASTAKQANVVLRIAKGMAIDAPDSISGELQPYRQSIRYNRTRSAWEILSSDAGGQHGYNASCLVADELHAHKSRDLLDAMLTSMGSRTRSLAVHLTTADDETNVDSVCNDKYDYAIKVRDGDIGDVAFLPVIWEAVKADDWADPRTWRKANPSLGASLQLDYLERECRRAIAQPSYQPTFCRLHLNMRVQHKDPWLPIDQWKACDGEVPEEQYASLPCWGGLDLSANKDVTCLTLLWRLDDLYFLRSWYWYPEETIREMKGDYGKMWRRWVNLGYVRTTPGNQIDYDYIRRDLSGVKPDGEYEDGSLMERYSITEIAVDVTFQGIQLSQQLAGDGLTMVPITMGYRTMSAPCLRLEVLLSGRKLRHGGDPVLTWMAGNVAVKRDAGGRMYPIKEGRTRAKVDGIITTLMALSRAEVADDSQPGIIRL